MGDHAPRRRGLKAIPAIGELPDPRVDPAAIEAGRRLFAATCRFVAGAASPTALPPEGLPEIAFIGRSNVGKSSLINALTGRRTLARISHTPGRTRQLNFFDLGGRLMLVDLPGHGYAAASKAEIAAWTALIRHYLRDRAKLMRAYLLIDARHGIMAADEPVMRLCDEAGLSYQVILTKTDKPRPAELERVQQAVAAALARRGAAHPDVLQTSARLGVGIAALRVALAQFAAVAPVGRAR
jgi:GTP-binding protein